MHAFLAGWFLVSATGTAAELYLLDHYESWYQRTPLILLVLGVVTGLAAAFRPSKRTFLAHRVLMSAFILAAVVGFALHFNGNLEWEAELHPDLTGAAKIWSALHGALPALAPFAMAHLGLLGLICTYRHPRLVRHAPAWSKPEKETAP